MRSGVRSIASTQVVFDVVGLITPFSPNLVADEQIPFHAAAVMEMYPKDCEPPAWGVAADDS